jgi:glycosyltransferase involved in cell wall biosynthesis
MQSDLKLPIHFALNAPLPLQHALMWGRLRSFDLVHRMDLRLPSAPVEVVTVHDVAPLRYADEGALPRHAAASLRRARAVVAPSGFAADDIANALGIERPTVIYNGVPGDAFTAMPLDPSRLRSLGIHGRYLMHCGGVSRRKNLQGLWEAWRILRGQVGDVQLVLAGPEDPRRTALFGGDDRVIMPGGVDRPTLLGIMTSADALIVPSLYEGFGFPAIEAMACGTVVVATRVAALPEVCGDGALLCDTDAEAMADSLRRALEDDELRQQLVHSGAARARDLTWDTAADLHQAVYARAIQGGGS